MTARRGGCACRSSPARTGAVVSSWTRLLRPRLRRSSWLRTPVSRAPLWPVQEILDGVFFVIGTVLVLWLGWIVVTDGFDGWFGIGSVIVFWVLLAYVGLPRLQEVLSKIYVPDYFIGRSLTDVGVLGDPINLALDGSEADIHAAMTPSRMGPSRRAHDPLLLGDRAVRRCFDVPTRRLRSPRCSSSGGGRPSPTSRRWTATLLDATTCVSGRSLTAGGCPAGSRWGGWPRRHTTGPWASRCSRSR